MSAYTDLEEMLGKLKRNETQMSEEQKQRYAKQLDDLKKEIRKQAAIVMREFLLSGIRIRKDDGDDACGRIEAVAKDEQRSIRKAMKILMSTYDTDEFLKALCPIQCRIFHEGYGPYWVSHCKPTGDPEFPYTNDLIGMEWWEGHNEWASTKIEDGKRTVDFQRGVTVMLPPTMELIKKDYQEEMQRYKAMAGGNSDGKKKQ